MPEPASPQPPGWFSDPSGDGSLRWWDGAQWTTHRFVGSATNAPPGDASRGRGIAALSHLGFPIFIILLPLAVWSSSAPQSFPRAHARQAFSFQVVFLACWVILVALMAAAVVSPVVLLAVGGVALVMELPNVVRASTGRAPLRFIPFELLAP